MTATTFSRPLLQAGSAVASSMGKAGAWSFARYMQAPLASTGLLAMVTLTALAASNALYFQTKHHPAPFFSPSVNAMTEHEVAPVPQPAFERPATMPAYISDETTGSVTPVAPQQAMPAVPAPTAVIPNAPVGNKDAFAVQKKLTELGLFNGTVDGFYGPQTAAAIRAFEARNNMTATGALTPGVIDAILKADANGRAPVIAPVAVVQPQPAPPVVQQPAQQDVVVARLPTLSPVDQTVDAIGNVAAQTVDSLVGNVDYSRGTPTQATISPVPPQNLAYSAPVPQPAPQPAPVQVASLEEVAPRSVTAVQDQPVPTQMLASTTPVAPANNVQLVSQIQRGLASLGFYHGSIDGHPGDGTARAIREFENFHSYRVTGQINPDLVGLLRQAGASI